MATTPQTCNWTGKSGKTYVYHVFPLEFTFKGDQPGNYIFAKLDGSGRWAPQ